MNIKLIIVASLFMLIVSATSAQEEYVTVRKLTTESNSLNYKLPGKQYYNMIVPSGSVFLYNDWKDGYLKLQNGDNYDHISLKYNIYYDDLITFNDRTATMIMLDKNTIEEFGLYQNNGELQVFKKMYFSNYPMGEYFFKSLYDNNLKLAVRYKSQEEETSLYKDAYGRLRNTSFKATSLYYIIFPDHQFKRFSLKRRSFVNMFSQNKKTVRRVLRKNHILFKNEIQTIQAVKLVEEALFSK